MNPESLLMHAPGYTATHISMEALHSELQRYAAQHVSAPRSPSSSQPTQPSRPASMTRSASIPAHLSPPSPYLHPDSRLRTTRAFSASDSVHVPFAHSRTGSIEGSDSAPVLSSFARSPADQRYSTRPLRSASYPAPLTEPQRRRAPLDLEDNMYACALLL